MIDVQLLLHNWLQPLRTRLDAEEYYYAAGLGHLAQQLFVYTVNSGAAAPFEAILCCDQFLTKCLDPFAIDRHHVVNEVKFGSSKFVMEKLHLRDQSFRRFNTVAPVKIQVGGA